MLNLFKKQWLLDCVREYIGKKFPSKFYKVAFVIDGKEVSMDEVKGNERKVKEGVVTYTDPDGNSVRQWLFLYKGEITFNSVDHAESEFALKGIEPTVRKAPRVGKKSTVEKFRKELKKKLSKAIDYCPGSFLDRTHEYPITDMPRWRRKRLLNLLANMSEDSIPVFVSFDLDHAAMSQLEQFNEELELAMMVENTFDPELEVENVEK